MNHFHCKDTTFINFYLRIENYRNLWAGIVALSFLSESEGFQKYFFLNFHYFFYIPLFPSRRWGVGKGVLKKIEKNLYPAAFPQTHFQRCQQPQLNTPNEGQSLKSVRPA